MKEILANSGQSQAPFSSIAIPTPLKNEIESKREDSESPNMEIDVEPMTKRKKIETLPSAQITIQEEETREIEKQEIPPQQTIMIVHHFPNIEST